MTAFSELVFRSAASSRTWSPDAIVAIRWELRIACSALVFPKNEVDCPCLKNDVGYGFFPPAERTEDSMLPVRLIAIVDSIASPPRCDPGRGDDETELAAGPFPPLGDAFGKASTFPLN